MRFQLPANSVFRYALVLEVRNPSNVLRNIDKYSVFIKKGTFPADYLEYSTGYDNKAFREILENEIQRIGNFVDDDGRILSDTDSGEIKIRITSNELGKGSQIDGIFNSNNDVKLHIYPDEFDNKVLRVGHLKNMIDEEVKNKPEQYEVLEGGEAMESFFSDHLSPEWPLESVEMMKKYLKRGWEERKSRRQSVNISPSEEELNELYVQYLGQMYDEIVRTYFANDTEYEGQDIMVQMAEKDLELNVNNFLSWLKKENEKYEQPLETRYEELPNPETKTFLKYRNHKLTLLHELGVIEEIRGKLNESTSNAKLATVIAELLGYNPEDPTTLESLRKAISYIDSSKETKQTNSFNAQKKVEKFFSDFDIERK